MIILGLHFGHDAAACVISDGELRSYVIRERITRVKHAATLDRRTIEAALNEAEITAGQIDYCAIASTQFTEPVIDDAKFFSIHKDHLPGKDLDSKFLELLRNAGQIEREDTGVLLDLLYDDVRTESDEFQREIWSKLFPEHHEKGKKSINRFFWFDEYIGAPRWKEGRTLDQIGIELNSNKVNETGLDRMFHFPVTVRLMNETIPATYIHHHFAHAAASFYSSPYQEAVIMTHDGFANGAWGSGYQAGMFYYGIENKIYPVRPHHLNIGGLYDRVGTHLGLGLVGAAGKLMGLASYGKPRFFDAYFVGNEKDFEEKSVDLFSAWLSHCETQAKVMGYDFSNYRNPDHPLARINADIAASTQELFEQIRLKAIEKFSNYLFLNDIRCLNLCLSGGTALNCPSNSQILNEGPFENVFVEPFCDDTGIALGAALCLHYNILGEERYKLKPLDIPFSGITYSEEAVERELIQYSEQLSFKKDLKPWKMAARDLERDMVIAWFEGRSEVGPRALGARSILADPRKKENWVRVNKIKNRESWRPFAPAILESELLRWFRGIPSKSPYMLFNAEVLSNDIPAVTHVDNTSRVQTVDKNNGDFYNLISEFGKLTGVPIVLNTSFNGPGEPIVESPGDAIRFFLKSELDTLYLDKFIVKKGAG